MKPRSLTLALLGLALAGSPALAAQRGESSGPKPAAAGAPAKAAMGRPGHTARPAPEARPAREAAPAARQAMHWQPVPVRGRPVIARGDRAGAAAGSGSEGTCLQLRGVARCRPQAVMGGGRSVMGWAHDLPPAAGVQAEECPAGTMATLARGHEDIVRCMPL